MVHLYYILKGKIRYSIIGKALKVFNIPDELGSGIKKDPLRVLLTSRELIENCQYLDRGIFQIDGTYRLGKNNFPWISNTNFQKMFLTHVENFVRIFLTIYSSLEIFLGYRNTLLASARI